VLGTTAAADTPLMSAGLDSIAATEFANVLVKRLGTELPQTVLFDHPTTRSLASFAAAVGLSNEASQGDSTIQVANRANEVETLIPVEQKRASVSLARRLSIALPGPY
jgi:hypothetical protein